ncbi:MAG TPA: OmpA family protein, partial [Paludibacter sp.]
KSNIRQDAMPILDSLVNLTYKYSITLDSLVTVLREKPITIEIGSHTDSRGTFEYNNRLSEERSKSVVEYLVKHNIDPSRIIAKGYGEYQLLNKCVDGVDCTEAEHQVNRRTEAKITGFTTPQIVIEYVDTEKFKDGDRIDKSLLPKGFFDECK